MDLQQSLNPSYTTGGSIFIDIELYFFLICYFIYERERGRQKKIGNGDKKFHTFTSLMLGGF